MSHQRLAPFRGLLPDERVELRTSPPYDVIDVAGAVRLRELDAENIVHVDMPVVVGDAAATDVGVGAEGTDAATAAAHVHAAELLDTWVAEGSLVPDRDPHLYAYTQTHTDRHGVAHRTAGVVGAMSIGGEGVLAHEETTRKAKSDRLESLRRTRTNVSMIYALTPATELTDLLEVGTAPDSPLLSVVDEDGVRHDLWRIEDPDVEMQISRAIESGPLVIADGHHRYTVAEQYRDEQPGPSPADRIMTFVVPLDPAVLVVRPIHRILPATGVGDADLDRVLAGLGTVREVDRGGLATDGVPVPTVVTAERALAVSPAPRPADREVLLRRPEALRDLAVTWTHDVLLPELGATEAFFHHDAGEVLDRVARGEAAAGVLLPAVTVDDIRRVAAAGERMPAKTTFFWPKARTGLVLRRFVDQEGLS
ncbi:MAG: DUF1015 domain-containing protein [Acidimicrobiia bacterium]|nr:DUF1015 domain-containing protein [Acidimicrobiia bacterium]